MSTGMGDEMDPWLASRYGGVSPEDATGRYKWRGARAPVHPDDLPPVAASVPQRGHRRRHLVEGDELLSVKVSALAMARAKRKVLRIRMWAITGWGAAAILGLLLYVTRASLV